MNKIILIDGNSMLNRAFYGLPDLTTHDGRHTNAVLGFLNILFKVIEEEQASHVAVAFDVKHPTFRHEMYSAYKGTRKPMPEELREQLPLMKEVLTTMNIPILERPGYEADDILGTLSKRFEAMGNEVTVLSGDRDLLQLASEHIQIKLPKTKAGKTVIEHYHTEDVIALYGVDPLTFIDMKGLMGDSSDNIPGVPGIGEKSAAKLLTAYGSMDGIYAAIDTMKESKQKENLIAYKEQAYLSKELATIKLDCELEIELDDLLYEDALNDNTYNLFVSLELKSLLQRFESAPKPKNLEFQVEVIEDFDRFTEVQSEIKNAKMLGISTITDGIEPIGLSVCYEENQVKLIPYMNFISEGLVSDFINQIDKSKLTISCLDIKSELSYFDFEDQDNILDVGLGAYLLDPSSNQYGYDDIARDYLMVNLPDEKTIVNKREINVFSFSDPEIQRLFAYMSYVPYMAASVIYTKLEETNMLALYKEVELPCAFVLYDMERYGIKVDEKALMSYGEKLKTRIEELAQDIYTAAGETFNILSTKQLGDILFEKLELPSGKKTKTGYSTNVDVLEKIKDKHPIVPMILEYRQLTKLNSTYVEGLVAFIAPDGRIHGKFNQTVTATGRISSAEPNLQNIPTRLPIGREIRKVFHAKEDFVLLDADYSQIELRVLAHLSEDQTLINAYHKDSDIHAITASEVFGVPLNEVDSLMRRRAKAVNFGIVYGISSFGLGQDLDISRKEAEGYIERYFATYQNVKGFMDKTVADAKKLGYTVTMFGRRRPIKELSSSNFMTRSFGERAAMNAPIQGTAADIIKIAMIRVRRKLASLNLKSRLILQVHDELLIETALDELELVQKVLVEEMENATKLSVPLVVDVHSGDSWYDAK